MSSTPTHDDLLERVRRADPAAGGEPAEPQPFALVAARLDEPTARDRPRGRPRPTRRRLAAGLAVASVSAAAILVAVALPVGDHAHLDVVAEARAELNPNGGILHTVTVQTSSPSVETYWLVNGVRRKITDYSIRSERWADPGTGDFHEIDTVPEVGPESLREASFVGGRYETTRDGVIQSARIGKEEANVLRRLGMLMGFPAISTTQADPVRALRRMLDDGEVRAAGGSSVDGRRVIRLIPAGGPRRPGEAYARGSDPFRPDEYLVDAATFAPVQVTFSNPGGSAGEIVKTTIRFIAYERLEKSPANERLLSIAPSGRRVVPNPALLRGNARVVEDHAKWLEKRAARHP